MKKIYFSGPSITNLEKKYVLDSVVNGFFDNMKKDLNSLQKRLTKLLNVNYVHLTFTCTHAMHLALLSCNIKKDDEVIIPDISWVATAQSVAYTGAKCIFVDVDPNTFCIDPKRIELAITKKTKAVMVVHSFGHPCDMRQIVKICNKYNLFLIEDAAPSLGSHINGKMTGTFGDVGCFSFQGAKMLVSGEGGMVVTNSKVLYEKVKKIQEHGRVPGTFWINEIGHKYKISNVAASIGLAQLTSVERQIAKKREINSWYREILSRSTQIKFQNEIPNSRSICWMTSVTIGSCDRNKLFEFLKMRGIDTRPTFPTISEYPMWKAIGNKELKQNSLFPLQSIM
jgi:perosamine synthetase